MSAASPTDQLDQIQFCSHPIFIIGSPRSGTSILAWSLAQHSQLWTSCESYILSYLLEDGGLDQAFERAKRMPKSWFAEEKVERAEFLRALGSGLNVLFTSRSQGKRWIDQTPSYTDWVDDLVEMFPGAFFIHILRDGRRVVHSMVNFMNALSEEARTALLQTDPAAGWQTFAHACQAWRHAVEVSMDFCARHPTCCLTIRNEELVADPCAGFEKILQFVGLPNETAPAEYFRSHRINSSFRADSKDWNQSPQLSEPWKGWTSDQNAIFWLEAGETFVKYGLGAEEEVHLSDTAAFGREYRRLTKEYKELEHWAHELEALARRQEEVIQTYRQPWASFTPFLRRFPWLRNRLARNSGDKGTV